MAGFGSENNNLNNYIMKTLKTITGREIKIISSNKKERTFIIKTESAKYKTTQMSNDDFRNALMFWTGNDWQNFLKTDEYYKIR